MLGILELVVEDGLEEDLPEGSHESEGAIIRECEFGCH